MEAAGGGGGGRSGGGAADILDRNRAAARPADRNPLYIGEARRIGPRLAEASPVPRRRHDRHREDEKQRCEEGRTQSAPAEVDQWLQRLLEHGLVALALRGRETAVEIGVERPERKLGAIGILEAEFAVADDPGAVQNAA